MNSTETPGGSGIPAGWYDDPSGQGLRWWDGERWTEHVHSAESAAAAAGTDAGGEREAPPPELVRLRESIRRRGAKGVGMVLGAAVLVIVVVALLLSGGSESKGGGLEPGAATPGAGKAVAARVQIRQLKKELRKAKLPKGVKKSLQARLRKLEKRAGESGGASAESAKQKSSGREGG